MQESPLLWYSVPLIFLKSKKADSIRYKKNTANPENPSFNHEQIPNDRSLELLPVSIDVMYPVIFTKNFEI